MQKPTLSSVIVRAKEPEKPKKEKIYNPAATPADPANAALRSIWNPMAHAELKAVAEDQEKRLENLLKEGINRSAAPRQEADCLTIHAHTRRRRTPTPENIHLYRAAALAWRNAWRAEKLKDKLANPHVPLNAAAVAVQKLEPEMTFEGARTFAQRALAWTGQTHNDWLFDRGQK